jgi:hypothetical protein
MKLKLFFACLFVASGVSMAQSTAVGLKPIRHTFPGPLPLADRGVFEDAMRLFDASYDPQTHFIRRPQNGHTEIAARYMVRESSWYALGLLVRDRNGKHPADAQRALDILDAVLGQQYLDPNVKWYGTFRRTPEEPLPSAKAIAFRGYDPNWRHFIGTTFEMILIEYSSRIPAPLQDRLYRSMEAAINGEMHDGRLVPSYTNIALMYGSLWNFMAVHDANSEWQTQSAAWNEEVYSLFKQQGAFNEFNAPTYYGVDLYGLGLWREYGSTAHMRELGSTMEAGMWNDIANFYQPNMRNLAGPWDRSYGMDMTRYVTPLGVYMRTVLPAARAPLPEHPDLSIFQIADIWFAPQATLLSAHIPPAALSKLRAFVGPHLVDRPIDSQRTATAWIGNTAIWGGEFTSRTKDTGHATQFHPVDAQWRMPSGEIGWLEITRSPNIDAIADRSGITIASDGDVTFRIYAGKQAGTLTKNSWTLPGLKASITTDADNFLAVSPPDCDGCVDFTYKNLHSMRINIQTPGFD